MKERPKSLTRRDFMRQCGWCAAGTLCGTVVAETAWARWGRRPRRLPSGEPREAAFWEPAGDGRTRCLICPNECVRGEGEITACRTRMTQDGKLYTLTYSKPCVLFTDALEKNPLYHVAPGSASLALGTAGCNLRCTYCQNWEFSQAGPWGTKNLDLSPEDVIASAKRRNIQWLTFSYTEPVAYYEYALETARLAHAEGLFVAVVTAGYINPKPLEKLMEYTDAFSVTLKGYTDAFYRDVVGCPLESVWERIVELARSDCWLEVVNLVVPTLNDEDKGFRSIARSLAKVDPRIPLHFLRFAPAFKLKNLPPTPRERLEAAHRIATEEGLQYVYLANLPGHESAHTRCPSCGELLIERVGFKVLQNRVKWGHCPACDTVIPGFNL
jgi:pyruvate formate lyase activating enzyme